VVSYHGLNCISLVVNDTDHLWICFSGCPCSLLVKAFKVFLSNFNCFQNSPFVWSVICKYPFNLFKCLFYKHFLLVYIKCAKVLHHGVSHMFILHIDQTNLYSLFSLSFHALFFKSFGELSCATFIHGHNVFWHCPYPHYSLSLLPFSLIPLDSLDYSHVFVYLYLQAGLGSAYEIEHVTFILLNLAYFA
jgi:hypothetical protein